MIALVTIQSVKAQAGKPKMPVTKATTVQISKYTCSMHPEVISNKPGKCPKCGMDLTKVKTYSCSMHPEVVSNKPGKCPKCGMDLTEVRNKSKVKKG